jgi:hypothetical protein
MTGLKNHSTLGEPVFSLASGKTKNILVLFFSGGDEQPAIYTGQLIINTRYLTKRKPIVLEITERKPLFDVRSELTSSTLTTYDKIKSVIYISNMGDKRKTEVSLSYYVADFEGNEYVLSEETVEVDSSIKLEKSFSLPQNLAYGTYVFYVKLKYEDRVATSASIFNLIKRLEYSGWAILLTVLILFAVLLVFYLYSQKRAKERLRERAVRRFEEANQKI